MKKLGALIPLGLTFLMLIAGCSHKPVDGFRPPIVKDPLEAQQKNWNNLQIVSGIYKTTFHYSDGKKISLKSDVVIDSSGRSNIQLVSDRGLEAYIIITPEFTNLLNMKEKYYISESTSAETSDRMVGLHLPSEEAASVLIGQGFRKERFDQILRKPAADGDLLLDMFHVTESLRAQARLDSFGRLRSIRYIDALSDEIVLTVEYLEFSLDKRSGIVWPTYLNIDLNKRGEKITLRATNVQINNEWVISRLESGTFARRQTGKRIYLDDVPRGDPLLYRNLKNYVEDDKK